VRMRGRTPVPHDALLDEIRSDPAFSSISSQQCGAGQRALRALRTDPVATGGAPSRTARHCAMGANAGPSTAVGGARRPIDPYTEELR